MKNEVNIRYAPKPYVAPHGRIVRGQLYTRTPDAFYGPLYIGVVAHGTYALVNLEEGSTFHGLTVNSALPGEFTPALDGTVFEITARDRGDV